MPARKLDRSKLSRPTRRGGRKRVRGKSPMTTGAGTVARQKKTKQKTALGSFGAKPSKTENPIRRRKKKSAALGGKKISQAQALRDRKKR